MGSSDRILTAAENIFARFGYRRASMSQIAEEAGLTRQALYHHYDSKEALFRAVVELLHEGAYEAEAAAGLHQEEAGGGLADILAAQIDARFRYLIECVEDSPQAEELLSEHQLQTGLNLMRTIRRRNCAKFMWFKALKNSERNWSLP